MRVAFLGLGMIWLAIIAVPVAAQTQITTGVIQGAVLDSTGAVVPGVNVEAVNLETNLTQTRTSGADGRFVFLQLPPGRYKVTFTIDRSLQAGTIDAFLTNASTGKRGGERISGTWNCRG